MTSRSVKSSSRVSWRIVHGFTRNGGSSNLSSSVLLPSFVPSFFLFSCLFPSCSFLLPSFPLFLPSFLLPFSSFFVLHISSYDLYSFFLLFLFFSFFFFLLLSSFKINVKGWWHIGICQAETGATLKTPISYCAYCISLTGTPPPSPSSCVYWIILFVTCLPPPSSESFVVERGGYLVNPRSTFFLFCGSIMR